MFYLSFDEQNVAVGPGRWLFAKRNTLRFEWIALLAYRRAKSGTTNGWVTIDEIAMLPGWKAKTRHHIGTNVGRYLDALERAGKQLVEARSRWVGPYRLIVDPASVTFDLPLDEAERKLRIKRSTLEPPRETLRRFVMAYARAESLFFQGRLIRDQSVSKRDQTAYGIFLKMAEDRGFGARLRLIAVIAATRVLFRLGRFGAARSTLADYSRLVRSVNDPVLEAQFHLASAWSYQRAESGTRSNRAVERSLCAAQGRAQEAGDRATLGLLAHRTSGLLTKKGRHDEAIAQLTFAVEAALVTGNFDTVQAYCGEMGSDIHRLGPMSYAEARRWLLTGIAIARWMKIGRDDAHGEMILGKIYAERDEQPNLSGFWLRRAEAVARSSGTVLPRLAHSRVQRVPANSPHASASSMNSRCKACRSVSVALKVATSPRSRPSARKLSKRSGRHISPQEGNPPKSNSMAREFSPIQSAAVLAENDNANSGEERGTMNGSNFIEGWVAVAGSVAMIALILTAFGLMLGIVKPADALRRVGGILGVVMLLLAFPAVVVNVWSSMSLWQQIGLVAIGTVVWQWMRPRRRTRNAKHH